MKTKDINIGGIYVAKVTGKLARIRIDRENARGGWDATILATNRRVRIRSARRLPHAPTFIATTPTRRMMAVMTKGAMTAIHRMPATAQNLGLPGSGGLRDGMWRGRLRSAPQHFPSLEQPFQGDVWKPMLGLPGSNMGPPGLRSRLPGRKNCKMWQETY